MQTTDKKINSSYKQIVKEALGALNKKNMALILHGVSFPSLLNENTGFGTYNSNGAKELMDFAGGMFNAIQLGPNGKTKPSDSSPYTGTVFSQNPLFMDLISLTTPEYDNLLSAVTLEKIVKDNPKLYENKAAYTYSIDVLNEVMDEVYENYKLNASDKMKEDFEKFKTENAFWLDNDALYEAFTLEHGSDYWPQWENELDRDLFSTWDRDKANARIKEITEKYADVIGKYKLAQFITAQQSEKTRQYAKEHGLKMIADRQVAFSDRDNWAYKSLFLDGWCLGCPPDYFSKDGQAWGFSVVDPEKMFNEDGSLGEAGELLYKLYLKMFKENPGGVRIDHTVGLIDPWVYKKGALPKVEEGAGRLYSSPFHPELKKYSIAREDDTNNGVEPDKEKWITKLDDEQISRYGRTIEKIVIAAAKEAGLDKDAIVAEDLGTLTYPVVRVMEKYELAGMKLVQFVVAEEKDHAYRCCNITENSWAMVGTHDNEPIRMWAQSMMGKAELTPHVDNLMDDLYANAENRDAVRERLYTDDKFLAFSKLVEIFAAKNENVQIFFTDFFGINEVYNRPGTSGDPNWTLRLPDHFEEFYERRLESGDALNLPLALIYAIKARGNDFAAQNAELIKKLESIA
ncbi:MAG: 4-alpha-glucanotransferase [Candidatus Gastranaerophilales bacterium]|nr:4-alpha-glucanotransferase [Candidatus Gastranaerophilales bacterium]